MSCLKEKNHPTTTNIGGRDKWTLWLSIHGHFQGFNLTCTALYILSEESQPRTNDDESYMEMMIFDESKI